MPLYRRLPKRGFLPYGGKTEFAIVNVGDLSERFAAGSVVDPDALAGIRLIHKSGRASVKVLGDGDVAHAFTVRAHKVSEGAKQKIEAAGGRVELLAKRVARAAK
jgi:large subunit ribosomal protein L15